jgi:hypothetical protein
MNRVILLFEIFDHHHMKMIQIHDFTKNNTKIIYIVTLNLFNKLI